MKELDELFGKIAENMKRIKMPNEISFPVSIGSVETDNRFYNKGRIGCGQMVAIRPCGEEYKGKTYLGIYLGDITIGVDVFFSKNESTDVYKLETLNHLNPAIFIPEFNKIVFGCESWWGTIKDESHLKQITDEDIQNVWYVKALKQLTKETK